MPHKAFLGPAKLKGKIKNKKIRSLSKKGSEWKQQKGNSWETVGITNTIYIYNVSTYSYAEGKKHN